VRQPERLLLVSINLGLTRADLAFGLTLSSSFRPGIYVQNQKQKLQGDPRALGRFIAKKKNSFCC
jgi:hypothetical protein